MILSLSDFKYPEQLGVKLPVLVLGVRPFGGSEKIRGYEFVNPSLFHNIIHQTSGVGCSQFLCQGTVIEPKAEVKPIIAQIAQKYDGSNLGAFGTSLNDLFDYNKTLKSLLDCSCNTSYFDLCEAVYPIDCENLPKVADCQFPHDYDDLIKWEDGLMKLCGCLNRWGLWILAENSD